MSGKADEPYTSSMPRTATVDDAELLARLRVGDEAAFEFMLDMWSDGMLRLARGFVSTADSAAEVVQETWLAVIAGIDKFEGRSTLKTWVFRSRQAFADWAAVGCVAWTDRIPQPERPAFIDDVLDRYGRLDDRAGEDVRVFRFYQLAAFLRGMQVLIVAAERLRASVSAETLADVNPSAGVAGNQKVS